MFKEFFDNYIYKYYKYIVATGVVVLCLILGVFYLSHNSKKINNDEKRFTANIISKDEITSNEEEEVKYFFVDIKGEVVNPNVYKLEENSRIIDVINLAGGLKEGADTSVLNLSKKIVDEMLIIIYSNDEINKIKEGNKTITEVIKIVEKECICPDPQINDACDVNEKANNETTMVNINNASVEDLMRLPGIGESKAKSIIDYRLENGVFTNIEDIKSVTGIGDSVFDKIKDYLTIWQIIFNPLFNISVV